MKSLEEIKQELEGLSDEIADTQDHLSYLRREEEELGRILDELENNQLDKVPEVEVEVERLKNFARDPRLTCWDESDVVRYVDQAEKELGLPLSYLLEA
jgi:chromosome segregation ATPase